MSESLHTIDGRHVLRMRRRLNHRPEKIWRALTEPAQLKHWFPAEVEIDPAVGTPVRFSFGGDGVVTAAEPPRLLEYTWEGTILRWELTPDGDGCVLDFIHTFDDRPGAASFAAGWDACHAALDALLRGRPAPQSSRMVREHEEFVHRFGLDRGEVRTTADGWVVRFERQLTVPEKEAREAWTFDGVQPEFTEGTGHGARLIVTITGRDGDPHATHDQWRQRIEAYAAQLAVAVPE
ncbi:SRPBCC family protein [Allorhizocola rhizosphaerae]|uniref:SRPBCC family protein n=1 Tax=Allorhizocola rhizosphaerae TaxID=1872709 RepID=UPI000E3D489B|nr:SRPBCC family protein [Allorhizocola rhizosphaerae]